jgi:hypothetical protein
LYPGNAVESRIVAKMVSTVFLNRSRSAHASIEIATEHYPDQCRHSLSPCHEDAVREDLNDEVGRYIDFIDQRHCVCPAIPAAIPYSWSVKYDRALYIPGKIPIRRTAVCAGMT